MKHRDEILDLVRGLSAVVVLAAHARGFVFRDLGELGSTNLATKAFYFATGIHHQAVMVFFVLSGYFVGGGVMKALAAGRFSWGHYAMARLSRLWVVLVPALVLTLFCDLWGSRLAPDAYQGGWRSLWMSGPDGATGAALDPMVFFGNLAFLQTVEVPVFGSNGPLWSLANEFWYYVLFPLVAVAVGQGWRRDARNLGLGAVGLGLAAMIAWWLPRGLVTQGLIWLLGVGCWAGLRTASPLKGRKRVAWAVAAGVVFLASLALGKSGSVFGNDYSVGIAFALLLLVLPGPWPAAAGFLRPVGRFLSEISYTLYVTHFPLLFLVSAVVLGGRQFEPSGTGFAWFAGMMTASLVTATVFWWLFERRTDQVRTIAARILFPKSRAARVTTTAEG